MKKEFIFGIVAGLILFLVKDGVDFLPFLFLATLAGVLFYMNPSRRTSKSFVSYQHGKKIEQKRLAFDDIGGQETAKKELREALEFIRDAKAIEKLGIRPLKGILLNGPPGTGKTLLAKAAAQYTQSIFLAASGSEFVEMYVGVGAQRIRQLFAQAKKLAKQEKCESAIIFIDEIEILGGKRGQASNNLEYDQTLNELLVQMDGLSLTDSVRILIIGATNRADMLDSALLRPGRFDRQVKVDLPDKQGRLQILELHTRNKPLGETVCLKKIASETFGFSGAHLESLTNEAAIFALREGLSYITSDHFYGAIDKVLLGERIDKIPNPEEKRRIAIHESGHALLSEITEQGSVASIHIASRSNALGYVRHNPQADCYLYTSNVLKSKIAVLMAGALSEELLLGNRSTGSSNDFTQAVSIAKQLVSNGMSDLGVISTDDLPKDLFHQTISAILKETEDFTRRILEKHKELLLKTSECLLEAETMTGEQLRLLLKA